MSDYLTTKELAAYLRIKERKVYDLAASGQVPCSRAMGKLLFPKAAVETWLAAQSSGPKETDAVARPSVFLGSHDPLLDWALRESRCGIASYFDGSLDGLNRFANREGIASGLHLYDSETQSWNEPDVRRACGGQPVVLVAWCRRERGLIIREDLASTVHGLDDLRGLRVASRQPEAGAQILFQDLCDRAGLERDAFLPGEACRTEVDTVLAVSEGKADAAFGLHAHAVQFRLPFVPLIEERFDLLVDRRAWFEPAMQTFLAFCAGSAFRARAQDLAGYAIDTFGEVRFNGP